MNFPHSIKSELDEVSAIIDDWPVKIDFDSVIKWILQFDSPDHNLALRIIRNLNIIGQEDINNALAIAYSKLMRKAVEKNAKITSNNTLFAGIGNAGKSGSMVSYHFRLINQLSEENFIGPESQHYLEQGRIDNIVLVDDIISTGNQATEEINELAEKVTLLGVKNIFVLSVCGFQDGIIKVENQTKAHTFAAFEYTPADTVTSLDSKFYEGVPHDKRQQLLSRLGYYGNICAKSGLGYGNIGSLIVFHYNTPNSTIPVIWGSLNDWIPLFRRVRRINGITSHYKQIDKAVKTKLESSEKQAAPVPAPAASPSATLTMFVEGKYDELFFDRLVEDKSLASRLGFADVSIVSLGTSYLSPRLVQTLVRTSSPAMFILDDDWKGRSPRDKLIENLQGVPCVFLRPSTFCLVDLLSLFTDPEFEAELGPLPPEPAEVPAPEVFHMVEQRLLRRQPPSVSQERIRRIVASHMNAPMFEEFIKKAREALEKKTGEQVSVFD